MEPLFKRLNILKISELFDKPCLKFDDKFCNDMLPVFFNSMYVKHGHIHQQHDIRQRDEIRNSDAILIMTEKCVRHNIPELLRKTPNRIIDKFNSHSLQGFHFTWRNTYLQNTPMSVQHETVTFVRIYIIIPYPYTGLSNCLCIWVWMHMFLNLLFIYWCMSIETTHSIWLWIRLTWANLVATFQFSFQKVIFIVFLLFNLMFFFFYKHQSPFVLYCINLVTIITHFVTSPLSRLPSDFNCLYGYRN